jgi:hypothetical protein
MARPCRITTVAVFIAHLLVRCCAHHAHACDCAVHSESDDAVPHDDCPGDCGDHSDHSRHGLHDCQGSPCSFILPGEPTHDTHGYVEDLPAPCLPLLNALPLASEYPRWQDFPSWDPCPLPVRLHLAHQVLLI